jgi:phospholipid transport system transporter-binding protein
VKLSLSIDNSSPAHLLISGELDQTTLVYDYWPKLPASDKEKLIEGGLINVDLANVERTDTAGLAWLVNLVKHAQANKVKVSFQSVPDKLLNLAD